MGLLQPYKRYWGQDQTMNKNDGNMTMTYSLCDG